jgi:DNA repair exonuclease SbcCD nuclease subunit
MILITADLHLNDLSRDQYRHDWMRNILPELLRKHKAELLIILGDISDEKDHLSSWLVNQTVDHLTALAQICPIILLKGNHDYIQADNPFYEFLGKIPGIFWISKPTVGATIHAENCGHLLSRTLFLPHTANYKRDWDFHRNQDFHNWEFDFIYAHQTFAGAQVGPRKLDGIPTDIFSERTTVFSGDIHVPQSLDQGQIVYTGSPYTVNFGDDFKPRIILLEDNGNWKSIPSPGPQKRLLELTYPNRKIEGSWTDYFTKIAERKINPGDILKVRVQIEPSQAPQWSAIKDEIHKWGKAQGYNIYLIQPLIDKTESGSMAKRKTVTRTDEQLVEHHIKSKSASEATLKTGQNLLRRV